MRASGKTRRPRDLPAGLDLGAGEGAFQGGLVGKRDKERLRAIPGLVVRFTLTVSVPASEAGLDLAGMMRDLADDFEAGLFLMTADDEIAILENPQGESAGCYTCHPEIRTREQ